VEERIARSDPAHLSSISDADIRKAFDDAFFTLRRRISIFAALPLGRLEGYALSAKLDAIGRESPTVA
jgi:hypothetical protein